MIAPAREFNVLAHSCFVPEEGQHLRMVNTKPACKCKLWITEEARNEKLRTKEIDWAYWETSNGVTKNDTNVVFLRKETQTPRTATIERPHMERSLYYTRMPKGWLLHHAAKMDNLADEVSAVAVATGMDPVFRLSERIEARARALRKCVSERERIEGYGDLHERMLSIGTSATVAEGGQTVKSPGLGGELRERGELSPARPVAPPMPGEGAVISQFDDARTKQRAA